MVREGIVLGHLISSKRLEVDKSKVEVIQDLSSIYKINALILHPNDGLPIQKMLQKLIVLLLSLDNMQS